MAPLSFWGGGGGGGGGGTLITWPLSPEATLQPLSPSEEGGGGGGGGGSTLWPLSPSGGEAYLMAPLSFSVPYGPSL